MATCIALAQWVSLHPPECKKGWRKAIGLAHRWKRVAEAVGCRAALGEHDAAGQGRGPRVAGMRVHASSIYPVGTEGGLPRATGHSCRMPSPSSWKEGAASSEGLRPA